MDRAGIDMTEGAITPKIARLAWPLVVGNLLQTVYNVADLFWVGRVGPAAVAAVSLMYPFSWLFVSTAMGITAATTALVSQYVGADEQRKADRTVAQTILLTLGVSATLATLGYTFRRSLLRLIGAEGAVFRESLAYIEVIFFAMPFTFLFFAFRSALQGAGDTRTAMWLMVLSAGVNVVIDPVFVLGWGPVPAMGTRGAGWATFISRGLVTAAGIAVLLRGGFGVRLYLRDLRPEPALLKRLVKIGYPATADGWARSFAAVVMAAFVTPFGTAAVAAYGVGIRLMSISWSVAGAVGQATATGVGQNLGAGTPDRAARLTWVAAGGTGGLLALTAAAVLAAPEIAVGVFVDDPAVIAEGRRFLYVIGPLWAVFGATMVIQGAFRGAGKTKAAMALSLLSRWGFRVPTTLALAFSVTLTLPVVGTRTVGFGIGVVGVWIGFSVGALLSFLVAVAWFRRGTWAEAVIEGEADPSPTGSPSVTGDDAFGTDDTLGKDSAFDTDDTLGTNDALDTDDTLNTDDTLDTDDPLDTDD